MRVTFFGTRGSIPVPDPDCAEFGGNTPCLRVTFASGRISILDAGSGLRKLGERMIRDGHEQFDDIVLGLSHTHWDHIQGFPFFKPAYDSRRHFTIGICGKGDRRDLQNIFAAQMQEEFFPVAMDQMGAKFDFWQPDATQVTHPSGVRLTASAHRHPGNAFGYRIEEDGRTLVYCTDVEHGESIDPRVVDLAKGADLLIHDAQYSPEELLEKRGWGHSSWEQAADVAERAGVTRLACFHHDPEHDDEFLRRLERDCRGRFRDSFFAREGMEVEI